MNDKTSVPATHQLPNGLMVHQANKPETEFLYREIFLERTYLKNGIALQPGACVFDVGANIGMFALFVKHECPDANIFCFEPIPALNELLARNLAPFGASARIFPKGVAGQPGTATLTYYPGYSIMSGFHADTANDAQILSSSIRKQVANSAVKRRPLTDAQISDMANYTLSQKVEIACEMTTVSQAIRETGVEKIDLLKIDAEKSELEILSGIHTDDWKKIAQIVLEAHSQAEAEQVSTLLRQQGFRLTLEQEDQLASSGVFNIFAVR
jgi:FkbM family methyltransferase